jgi:hypothetical protein
MESWLALLRAGAPPELVWGLVPRIIGALYVVAFASLSGQLLGLIGSRGISPAREQLAVMHEHFPGWRRFVRLPTLLWLSPSDRMLRALPWLGMAAGLFVMYGGPGTRWGLLVCFVSYLSLDIAALMFPWDCLLFEASFLTLFLPETSALPELSVSQLPLPVAAFAMRFLLIRLMWGFAKLKFIGTKRGDSLYLRGFMAWMPMCTPLGFRMHHMPDWLLRVAYGFMWVAEVVCPGLAFFRGAPRLLGALGLMGLMGGIWATGNWGFFNVGYGALCVALFDTQSSIFDTSWALVSASPQNALVHVVLALHTISALLYFPNNSWGTHTIWFLPFDEFTYTRPLLRALFAVHRVITPFRLVHGYGVFPPNSSPPIKLVPVFEGSADGVEFHAYRYRYMPVAPDSRTPIVAPHHPRLDHLCVYAGSGMSESDYLASLMGAGKSYGFSPFSHYSWLHRVMQRLLEGEPSVRALFANDPFPDAPPKLCRVTWRALTPNSPEGYRRTRERWQVRPAGVLMAARGRSELVFKHWLSPPELLHPDAVFWRRVSPALGQMLRAYASGTPHQEAVRIASDLSAAEVADFWQEFVPLVARTRGDFASIDAVAAEVEARFGGEGRLRMERIAERYVYLMRPRLEPHIYGGVEPKLKTTWNLSFHFLMQELVLDGREAFEGYLRDPASVAERAARMNEQTLLHFVGVMRNETIRYHGRALRLLRRITKVFEEPIPGILEFRDLLTQHRPADEVWLPECARSESGVWSCSNFLPLGEAALGARAEPRASTLHPGDA